MKNKYAEILILFFLSITGSFVFMK